ncbi:hypothetical protein G7085_10560 [Tessaracoccus sp. HDW20]|uniref:hypothetical protein n=1 Tax=Tessaracoccus coleopterorum TaxID=2714950 RepID=UPI0018D3BF9A|nr:hypothetical protein [Tessaracoccus coleopterorum]NHB84897.1 hypothetical protein [Tessaracoccus coleopterorum]
MALYRLTFGQPRQEDMLALMKARFTDGDASEIERLRIDLSAPTALEVSLTAPNHRHAEEGVLTAMDTREGDG